MNTHQIRQWHACGEESSSLLINVKVTDEEDSNHIQRMTSVPVSIDPTSCSKMLTTHRSQSER